jgi:hypothetical protein
MGELQNHLFYYTRRFGHMKLAMHHADLQQYKSLNVTTLLRSDHRFSSPSSVKHCSHCEQGLVIYVSTIYDLPTLEMVRRAIHIDWVNVSPAAMEFFFF